MKIIKTPLLEEQYYKTVHKKNQIVIHHTVSNGNAKNVVAWWNKTKEHIGTAFIIDREGVIHQCFDPKLWAHHLGMKHPQNIKLNQQSIGIELCNWGGLVEKNGRFYSSYGKEVTRDEVQAYSIPFRGFRFFQKYTAEQLESLKQLLQQLTEEFDIPKEYHPEIWDVNAKAIHGISGIYTHVSYRRDKSDCHPQSELIEKLQTL